MGEPKPSDAPADDSTEDVDVKKTVRQIATGVSQLLDKKESEKPPDPPPPDPPPSTDPPTDDPPKDETSGFDPVADLGNW